MEREYNSIDSLFSGIRNSSPDIYKYYNLFFEEDSKSPLCHDDYGYYYMPKSVNLFLNRYAQKNELDFQELILIFRMGYLEGKMHFREKMEYELKNYKIDGVKNYLLNNVIGSNGGRFPVYVGIEDGIPINIHPKRIREVGFNNGVYYEAWRELIEKHWLINDFFKEINIKAYKQHASNPRSQMFPKRYIHYSHASDGVQSAIDFNRNCHTLIDVLKNKIIPFKNEEGKIQNLHFIITLKNRWQFYSLCDDFLKEAANNHVKNLLEINRELYKINICLAEECIEILSDPIFQQCDMSIFEGFEGFKGNWFEFISRDLIGTVSSFKEIYSFIFEKEIKDNNADQHIQIQTTHAISSREENSIDVAYKNNDSITDFLIGNDEEKKHLLSLLKNDLQGKKGKRTAIIILALEQTNLIDYNENKELFTTLTKDLKVQGTQSGFNKYLTIEMRNDQFLQDKVSLYVEKVKKHMESIPSFVI